MKRWLSLTSYHWLVLFFAMGACAILLAWISFGLINVAMANYNFLSRYGLMAIAEGGLVQAIEIAVKSFFALLFYFCFKAIEVELIYRWRNRKD